MNDHTPERQGSRLPIPDPTTLTTEALQREIAASKDLLRVELRVVSSEVQHLKELTDTRFAERDVRVDQAFIAYKEAVATALASAKEAVEKSESTMNKQLDGITTLIATSDKAHQEQLRALEKRVDRDEGKGMGLNQAWLIGVAALGTIISLVLLFINMSGN